jgi:hypothetical protein
LRIPPGTTLLLVGSGLYWLLSSQLISSFTVLSPGIFESLPSGKTLITVVGIIFVSLGLWHASIDLEEFHRITMRENGYLLVLPIALVALDMYSTMISLSLNSQTVELNPFVASAIQYGYAAIVPFLIAYMALSEGLGLLMLSVGKSLFQKPRSARLLPFALVSAASSFGPFSNLVGMGIGYVSVAVYLVAGIGSSFLAVSIYKLGGSITASTSILSS